MYIYVCVCVYMYIYMNIHINIFFVLHKFKYALLIYDNTLFRVV